MPRGVTDYGRRVRSRLIVYRILVRAKRKGWRPIYTAEVIARTLTPNRIRFGIVGPCFYCGTDFASTVDHLVPVIEGGTDDDWNLVSCCVSCNSLKHDMPVRRFLENYPWGCNDRKAFERRVHVSEELRDWGHEVQIARLLREQAARDAA